jgi:hypothetical protein
MINFDMSNIKITQLIKYKENLILNIPSKAQSFLTRMHDTQGSL